MPAHERFRANDANGSGRGGPQPIKPYEYKPINFRDEHALGYRPSQHIKLTPKHQVFGLEVGARLQTHRKLEKHGI